MCGICGKLTYDGRGEISEKLLRGMLASLIHRGPDDEGLYIKRSGETSIALGHRRLGIIDLSAAGRQPLANEDGSVRIACNGEIYNHQELREELRQRGHLFRSRSDTEVIPHLYEEEGIACVGKLVGMFAFALWDEKGQTLHLVRDHAGIKPLVYHWDGRALTFASELKALAADPTIPRELDRRSLEIYLTLNYIPAPLTIYRNIRKLPPGACLTVRDRQIREWRYWDVAGAGAAGFTFGKAKSGGRRSSGDIAGGGAEAAAGGETTTRTGAAAATGESAGAGAAAGAPVTGAPAPPLHYRWGGRAATPPESRFSPNCPETATPEECFPPGDREAARRSLAAALERAVQSQMIADVPLGAFLSGGIDSGIVVALLARNSPRPVQTFTIGYTDLPRYDERAHARSVAMMYGTEHHEIPLSSREMISAAPEVLASLDEPFGDSSAIPAYAVSRETRKHVKVALSGDGGDELFAGYRMYRGEELYRRYRRIPFLLRKLLFEPLVAALPSSREAALPERVRRAKKFLRGARGGTPAERFLLWNELFPADERKRLLNRDGFAIAGDDPAGMDHGEEGGAAELFAAAFARFPGGDGEDDCLNRMLYADFSVSLPGDMLRKVDAMSMAHSLEVRTPLLDHRVCELAFAMPGDWKLRDGRGKAILIDACGGLLPPEVPRLPKRGFEVPIGNWLKGEWRFLLDEYLSRESIKRQGLFRPDFIAELTAGLFSGRADTSWQLWNLICFQAWFYNHLERRPDL
ncbi:MAG: asparagine synthase-related protein [Pseudomonadota bacterium]|nr:asparagine synthase-related protein [Pseudomonadota bacterium]